MPFGPYRLWFAIGLATIQAVWTLIVRRRALSMTDELGNYLVVEHALIAGLAVVAPDGYIALSIVAVGSLGANSPYLPARWHRTLAAITISGLVVPGLVHGSNEGALVSGAGILIVGQIALGRSGTLILADEVAQSARHQADHDSLTGLANRRVLKSQLEGHESAGASVALLLMHDLHAALGDGQVRPWFQPQVDVTTGHVVGGEALARWHHPTFGVISAGELLEQVELAGAQAELSVSILRQALDRAGEWPRHVMLSVNVTLSDVQSMAFVRELDRQLERTGFHPRRLTLEVVEKAREIVPETLVAMVERIRATGVSVSLDDFGQASSSLARLDMFDVDELKIDRLFVSRMLEHHRDRAIVDSIIGLAKDLGLRVVAEGVENEEMAQAVADAGVTIVQGYHYARPTQRLHTARHGRVLPRLAGVAASTEASRTPVQSAAE